MAPAVSPYKAFGIGATLAILGALILIGGLIVSVQVIPSQIASTIDDLANIDPDATGSWAYGQNITSPNYYKSLTIFGLCSTDDDSAACLNNSEPRVNFYKTEANPNPKPLVREYGPFVFAEKGSKKHLKFSEDNCTVSHKREIIPEYVRELSAGYDPKNPSAPTKFEDKDFKIRVWNPAYMGLMQYTGGHFGFSSMLWSMVLQAIFKMVNSNFAIGSTLNPTGPVTLPADAVLNINAFGKAFFQMIQPSLPPGVVEPQIQAVLLYVLDAYTGFTNHIAFSGDQSQLIASIPEDAIYYDNDDLNTPIPFFKLDVTNTFSRPCVTMPLTTTIPLTLAFFDRNCMHGTTNEDPMRPNMYNFIKPALSTGIINMMFTNNAIIFMNFSTDEFGDPTSATPTPSVLPKGFGLLLVDYLINTHIAGVPDHNQAATLAKQALSLATYIRSSAQVDVTAFGPCKHGTDTTYCTDHMTKNGLDPLDPAHVKAFNVWHFSMFYFNTIERLRTLSISLGAGPALDVSPINLMELLGFSHTHYESAEKLIRGYTHPLLNTKIPPILPFAAPGNNLDQTDVEILSTGMCDGDVPKTFVAHGRLDGTLNPYVYPAAAGEQINGYDGTKFPRQQKFSPKNKDFAFKEYPVYVTQVYRSAKFALEKVYENDLGITVGDFAVTADLLAPTAENAKYGVTKKGISSNFGALTAVGLFPPQNNKFAFLSHPHFYRTPGEYFKDISFLEIDDEGKHILHLRPNITRPHDQWSSNPGSSNTSCQTLESSGEVICPFTEQADDSLNTTLSVEPVSGATVGLNKQLMGGINPPAAWFEAVRTIIPSRVGGSTPQPIYAKAPAKSILNGDGAHVPYYILKETSEMTKYSADSLKSKLFKAIKLARTLTIAFAIAGTILLLPGLLLIAYGAYLKMHGGSDSYDRDDNNMGVSNSSFAGAEKN